MKGKEVMTNNEDLKKAKENVFWLLDHPNGLVDMHSLVYWASMVEKLREDVKNDL